MTYRKLTFKVTFPNSLRVKDMKSPCPRLAFGIILRKPNVPFQLYNGLQPSVKKGNNASLIPPIAPIVQHQTLALESILHNFKLSELPGVLRKDVSVNLKPLYMRQHYKQMKKNFCYFQIKTQSTDESKSVTNRTWQSRSKDEEVQHLGNLEENNREELSIHNNIQPELPVTC